MPVTLPPLPFPSDALEPHIDKMTMEIHHGKHHKAYVDNLNKALEELPDLQNKPLHEILANNLALVPQSAKPATRAMIRNNGGGHHNHSLFWEIMGPKAGGAPIGNLAKANNSEFGTFDNFKTTLADAGVKRFGSGW